MIPASWGVLERLAASPVLQAAFCGGADPAWIADLEAGRIRPEPSIVWTSPARETAETAIAVYLDTALARAESWVSWHQRRAVGRGLAAGADNLSRIGGILRELRRAPRASAGWLAIRLLRSAIDTAEREWAAFGFHAYVKEQFIELDSSHLRSLVFITIPGIVDRQWQLREGYMTATEAQIAAAEDLAFAAGYPPEDGSDEN